MALRDIFRDARATVCPMCEEHCKAEHQEAEGSQESPFLKKRRRRNTGNTARKLSETTARQPSEDR